VGKYKCGAVYFSSNLYNEEAGKTANACLINDKADLFETVNNRRTIKGKLAPAGQKALEKVLEQIQHKFPDKKFIAKFDRYAGCNMCPCSPGFTIYEVADDIKTWERARGNEQKIECWVGPRGKLDLRLPSYGRYAKHRAA
jgi:hypothetical protein